MSHRCERPSKLIPLTIRLGRQCSKSYDKLWLYYCLYSFVTLRNVLVVSNNIVDGYPFCLNLIIVCIHASINRMDYDEHACWLEYVSHYA